jgi:hypothetical protein
VQGRDYLLADGKWDFDFRLRRQQADNPFSQQVVTGFDNERWLTVEQDKLLKVIRANLDEDIHVQGYAGIGKSYLLGALMDCPPRGRVLALDAHRPSLAPCASEWGWTRSQRSA